jgi:hypothetical protein
LLPGSSADWQVKLLAKLLELQDGCRALHVGGNHQGVLPLFAQIVGEFGDGGGFAGALQAYQHDDRWRRACIVEFVFAIGATQHLDQLLVDDFDYLLRGREAFQHFAADGALLHPRYKLLDDLKTHVGFKQRLAHLAHGLGDIAFCETTLAPQTLKYRI